VVDIRLQIYVLKLANINYTERVYLRAEAEYIYLFRKETDVKTFNTRTGSGNLYSYILKQNLHSDIYPFRKVSQEVHGTRP
jgi:hypothetical protein